MANEICIRTGMHIPYKEGGIVRYGVIEQVIEAPFPGKVVIKDDEDGKTREIAVGIGW